MFWQCEVTFGCEQYFLIWSVHLQRLGDVGKSLDINAVRWIIWEHRGQEINLKMMEISSKRSEDDANMKSSWLDFFHWSWWLHVCVVLWNQCKRNTSFNGFRISSYFHSLYMVLVLPHYSYLPHNLIIMYGIITCFTASAAKFFSSVTAIDGISENNSHACWAVAAAG